MLNELYLMVNTRWIFLTIVGNHDESLVPSLAESVDDILHKSAVTVVKTMQRLIEDDEFRVLDKGTGKQDKTLFTT